MTGFILQASGNLPHQITDTTGFLVDKPLLYVDNTAIILTMGQSNATSHGQGDYDCRNSIYEYFRGNLYKASEPLLGAPGNGGCSVWTRLADMLIDSGYYQQVILVNTGIGATTVQCWSEGECNKELRNTLQFIKEDSLSVTHVFWHQGESDNLEETSREDYKKHLQCILALLQEYGIHADLYVCRASYHPAMIGIKDKGVDSRIRSAQTEFILENENVRPGPDTDQYDHVTERHDGVHFSRKGLNRFAYDLFISITK